MGSNQVTVAWHKDIANDTKRQKETKWNMKKSPEQIPNEIVPLRINNYNWANGDGHENNDIQWQAWSDVLIKCN